MKKMVLLIAVVMIGTLFTACGNEEKVINGNTEQVVQDTLTIDVTDTQEKPKHEKETETEKLRSQEWKKNYSVKYEKTYYGETSERYAKVCAGHKLYMDDDGTHYFVQDGTNVIAYTLDEETKEGTSSKKENQDLNDYSTKFENLVEIKPDRISKMKYVGDEVIAGRDTKKYVEETVVDGKLLSTGTVWIDNQYDICLKMETIMANSESQMMNLYLTVTDFDLGKTRVNDMPDLKEYKIIEEKTDTSILENTEQ